MLGTGQINAQMAPSRRRTEQAYKWQVMTVVIFGLFMVMLDTTIMKRFPGRSSTDFAAGGVSLHPETWKLAEYGGNRDQHFSTRLFVSPHGLPGHVAAAHSHPGAQRQLGARYHLVAVYDQRRACEIASSVSRSQPPCGLTISRRKQQITRNQVVYSFSLTCLRERRHHL